MAPSKKPCCCKITICCPCEAKEEAKAIDPCQEKYKCFTECMLHKYEERYGDNDDDMADMKKAKQKFKKKH